MEQQFNASLSYEAYEQKGYLNEDFRFFHIKSSESADIPYHYHDFHKLILVLSGDAKLNKALERWLVIEVADTKISDERMVYVWILVPLYNVITGLDYDNPR